MTTFRALRSPVLLLAFGLAALLPLSCRDGDDDAPGPAPAAAAATFRPGLYWIGNDRGMIRPCGCSKPVLGGIRRRADLFARIPSEVRERSAVLAVGDLVVEGGRQQELKVETFLELMNTLGVGAFLPGDGDLALGTRTWRDVRQLANFPFVSLNLVRDGRRLFDDHALLTIDGRETVVTGFVSPRDNALNEPGVEALRDPDVTGVLAALAGDGAARRPLVLWGTDRIEDLRVFARRSGLAAAADGVLYLVRGAADVPFVLERGAGAMAAETGAKGREVAWTDWPAGQALKTYTLDESFGSTPLATELLDYYRENVDREDLLGTAPRIGQAEGAYAGAAACAACHPQAHETWRASGHGRAWATLVESGDARDPECVRCHVVDFGLEGGFDPAEPAPVDVQCEACHGPAAEHAATLAPTPRQDLGPGSCHRCHDLANSPGFTFDAYWPRIAHGRD